jgi:hypothetical protein
VKTRPPRTIAVLHGARRVWAVGAVHGAALQLHRLHDLIGERFESGDRIVYLGGYLGYGAAVHATIDELVDFRRRVLARQGGFACDVTFLRGAQEEMLHKLLQLQLAANPGEVLSWMIKAGMASTIAAYGGDPHQGTVAARGGPRAITRWTSALRSAINAAPGHRMLFSSLRHAAFTLEESGVLFVHAAVAPSRLLAAQGDAFWWGDADILDLRAPFAGFRRVVRGIDRHHRGLVEREFAVSLDAGAAAGGPLLAACFAPDGTILDRLEA